MSNIDTSFVREIANTVKNEPWSVLMVLSVVFLPYVISEWLEVFPGYPIVVTIVVAGFLVIAATQLRRETAVWRRKTILLNYLRKRKRASFEHLTKEWDAREQFTEKDIKRLLLEYPDVFKRVQVRSRGDWLLGVGLVEGPMDFEKLQTLVDPGIVIDVEGADVHEVRASNDPENDDSWKEFTPERYASEDELAAAINRAFG